MPEPLPTWCANCQKKQPDPMRRRATCPHCGCSPLPSRAYGPDAGALYPKVPAIQLLIAEVQRRRAEREKT